MALQLQEWQLPLEHLAPQPYFTSYFQAPKPGNTASKGSEQPIKTDHYRRNQQFPAKPGLGRQSGLVALRVCSMAESASGLTLAAVLVATSGLFCLATLFFGSKGRGGFYDSKAYEGNGTAH